MHIVVISGLIAVLILYLICAHEDLLGLMLFGAFCIFLYLAEGPRRPLIVGGAPPVKLDPVMDCRLNFYDVAQQCCLLQSHLENPKRRCHDCLKKHFLTIIGLLNEARSLNDKKKVMRDLDVEGLIAEMEELYRQMLAGKDMNEIAQKVRQFRKKIQNAGLALPPPYP